ncbi:MAG: M23 family metallopeptidase [Brachymonas sp.]|nr:M23 family metallopeptidase [Brachymonas sp.]
MSSFDSPTVLVVSADQTQTVSINPRLLFAIKPLLAVLTVLLVALLAALSLLGVRYFNERQQFATTTRELQQQVLDLQNFTSTEINAKLTALQKSEKLVQDLQNYLKDRGVAVKPVKIKTEPGKPIASAGGPVLSVPVQNMPFSGAFIEGAETLLQAVQRTPLGVPHKGPLTSRFGNRPNPFTGRGSEFHGGIDIKGKTGEDIRATANGKVTFAGVQNGYGKVVRVAHGHGYETVYAHLSRIDVKAGQAIEAGHVVGLLGSTGRSTGPHLHYEVVRNGERLDPENYLSLDVSLLNTAN